MEPALLTGSPANTHTVLDPAVNYLCQRCGACCKWPGDVRVDDAEIASISAWLEMDADSFIARYTRLRTNRQGLSLVEKENHECVMLENGACLIHEVKPEQCRGFPNKWNFPGWRDWCEAIPVPVGGPTKNVNKEPDMSRISATNQSENV